MKKVFLISIAFIFLFSNCTKEDINLKSVKKIVITGQFLNADTGEPLTLTKIKGAFGLNTGIFDGNLLFQYRLPGGKPGFWDNRATKSDGSFEINLNSPEQFILQQGINWGVGSINHEICEEFLINFVNEPNSIMPFGAFEQKQIDTVLTLKHDIKLKPMANVAYNSPDLIANDSLIISTENVDICSGKTSAYVNKINIIPLNPQSPQSAFFMLKLVPNRDYKITFTRIRANSPTKSQDVQVNLMPSELKNINVKFD